MKRNHGRRFGWITLVTAAAAAVLLGSLSGCETPARRLAPKAVQAIQPGVTTRQDILRDFGTPYELTTAKGQTVLFYERDHWPAIIGQNQRATFVGLSVLCDQNDRVLRTHHSIHQIDVRWSLGSVSAGSLITDKTINKLRPNVTTPQEAIALLGEPWIEKLWPGGGLVMHWGYVEGTFYGRRQDRDFRLLFNEAGTMVSFQNGVFR